MKYEHAFLYTSYDDSMEDVMKLSTKEGTSIVGQIWNGDMNQLILQRIEWVTNQGWEIVSSEPMAETIFLRREMNYEDGIR